MSCLIEMMPLPIVSPSGNRVVDHQLLLGVTSSSDRSWLHLYEGCNIESFLHDRMTGPQRLDTDLLVVQLQKEAVAPPSVHGVSGFLSFVFSFVTLFTFPLRCK